MNKLAGLEPGCVFAFFEQICAIARGSGNMDAISSYCMAFAAARSLEAVRDEANNVIIYKPATPGYEASEPVILQGHLDMVCQKEDGYQIDFERDGLSPYVDGDFVKAHGTTLGADNGIAVAMILAILDSKEIAHPPIEAVFTTDEEIGMIGAGKLCTDRLRGRRMINLDAEEPDKLTVSCAGGSDFVMRLPVVRSRVGGERVTISLKGLKGGHSGVEIGSGRVNAAILMGRVLQYAKGLGGFDLICVDGGDKGNAIAPACTAELAVRDGEAFAQMLRDYLQTVRTEIARREEGFSFSVCVDEAGEHWVMDAAARDRLCFVLTCVPNGVMEMSAEIEGLVETSLNLGILKTDADCVTLHHTLRSNKQSALDFLRLRLTAFAKQAGCEAQAFGHYPPWEFKENSPLQQLYTDTFREQFGYAPEVAAIHAGLECGIFASRLEGLDCIAIGPQLLDVHTPSERLSIRSTGEIFALLLRLLERCK